MKSVLKILFFMICTIPCIWSVVKAYQPKFDKYETYIKDCKACEDTQRKLQLALLSYSGPSTSIGNVRDETDFLRVERLLIDSGCLDRNYNRSSKECFYVIVDKKVICACHADVEDIDANIERANRMLEKKCNNRRFDLIEVAFGCLILFFGLFC